MSDEQAFIDELIPLVDPDDVLPPSVPELKRQDGANGCDCEARRVAAAAALARSSTNRQRHCPCCMHWKPRAKRVRNRRKKTEDETPKPPKEPKEPKKKRSRKRKEESIREVQEEMVDKIHLLAR